jgi:hypothetical protein
MKDFSHSSAPNGDAPNPDDDAAVKFLKQLRPDGPWLLMAIDADKGPKATITATAPEAARAFVAKHNARRNLYYSVNPTRAPMDKKPEKADIAAAEYLFADCDPREDESPADAKARYRETRAESGLPVPTFIVDSGNGLQMLWRLNEPINLPDPANAAWQHTLEDVEARNKALLDTLGAPAGTQNIDRILRLPGTTNLPNKTKRKKGRTQCEASLLEFNDAAYPLDRFLVSPPGGGGDRRSASGKRGDKTGRDRRDRQSEELPRALTLMLHLDGPQPGGYASRSELLWAFINEALRRNIDENAIVNACTDTAFFGHSVFEHVREDGGAEYVRRQITMALNELPSSGDKPIIPVRLGALHETWRATERALRDARCPVFVRGGRLVWPQWRWEQADKGGGTVLTCQVAPYNAVQLQDMIAHHAASFTKYDARTRRDRPCDPPKDLVEALLHVGHWDFPSLKGIINTPTLRPDGTILTEEGYDATTQLWMKPSGKIDLSAMPRPTRANADAALERLDGLLEGFPLDEQSRSGALAGLLTTVFRGAFPAAPIFLITAPEPRSGKTFYVQLVSVLATGHRPVNTAGSANSEEMEKQIGTAALAGRPVLHLNNLPNGMTLDSPTLAQIATDEEVTIRKLGKLEEGTCDCRAMTVFVNGNNVLVAGDLVERTVRIRLNARTADPGSRIFEFDPVERVRKDRGAFLADCFTVVRAYLAAGAPCPGGIRRVAGFDDWSRFVQQPLVWLGRVDPLKSQETARAADPRQRRAWPAVSGAAEGLQ